MDPALIKLTIALASGFLLKSLWVMFRGPSEIQKKLSDCEYKIRTIEKDLDAVKESLQNKVECDDCTERRLAIQNDVTRLRDTQEYLRDRVDKIYDLLVDIKQQVNK